MSYHECPIEPSDWSDGNGDEGNCRTCEGTGEVVDDHDLEQSCPDCGGSGWADWPSTRLNELQAGNPSELEIIGLIPGGQKRESEIHRMFSHLRIRGEWFRASTDLLLFIKDSLGKEVAS